MRGLKVLLSACVIALLCAGCSTSDAEKARGKEYVDRYEASVTDYIKQTYTSKAKVVDMRALYTTVHDAVWFGSENIANGMISAEVKLKKERFSIIYIPESERYITNRHENAIKESFYKYVEDLIGKDNLLFLKFDYGVDDLYYTHKNFVGENKTSFEQVFDEANLIDIECYVKNTDVTKLRDSHAFQTLEDLILADSNIGLVSATIVNIDQEEDLEDSDWRIIRYQNYIDHGYIELGTEIYSAMTCEYTQNHPNSTFYIGCDDDEKLTLVY